MNISTFRLQKISKSNAPGNNPLRLQHARKSLQGPVGNRVQLLKSSAALLGFYKTLVGYRTERRENKADPVRI